MDAVEMNLLETCHDLARSMVRLDWDARRTMAAGLPADDLTAQREEVQVHRSWLLRQMWEGRREALRQARV